jgi:hypothetical protein
MPAKDTNVRIRISGRTDEIVNATKQVDNRFKQMGRNITSSLDRVNSHLNKARMGIVAVTAVIGVGAYKAKQFGESIIREAADMEKYHNTLATVLKDSTLAAEKLRWAVQKASETPFEVKDIVKATTQLEIYGANAEKWLPLVGDLAAVMGKDLEEAAMGVGKALSGAASGLMILRNMGIRIRSEMVREAGKSEEGMAELGKAIEKELLKFEGGMAKLAKTWDGTLSMIQDWWSNFLRDIADTGMFDTVKGKLEALRVKLNQLRDEGKLDEWAEWIGGSFVLIVDKGSKVVTFFGDLLVKILDFLAGTGELGQTLLLIAGGLAAISIPAAGLLVALPILTPLFGALMAIITAMISPIGLVVAGLAGLAGVLWVLKQRQEEVHVSAQDNLKDFADEYSHLRSLADRYDELKEKTHLSNIEREELKKLIEEIAGLMPASIQAYNEEGEAIAINTGILRENLEVRKKRVLLDLPKAMKNEVNIQKALYNVETERLQMQEEWEALIKVVNIMLANQAGEIEDVTAAQEELREAWAKLTWAKGKDTWTTEELLELYKDYPGVIGELTKKSKEYEDALQAINEVMVELGLRKKTVADEEEPEAPETETVEPAEFDLSAFKQLHELRIKLGEETLEEVLALLDEELQGKERETEKWIKLIQYRIGLEEQLVARAVENYKEATVEQLEAEVERLQEQLRAFEGFAEDRYEMERKLGEALLALHEKLDEEEKERKKEKYEEIDEKATELAMENLDRAIEYLSKELEAEDLAAEHKEDLENQLADLKKEKAKVTAEWQMQKWAEVAAFTSQTANQMFGNIGRHIAFMTTTSKGWGKAWRDMWGDMGRQALATISAIIVKMLVLKTLSLIPGFGGPAGFLSILGFAGFQSGGRVEGSQYGSLIRVGESFTPEWIIPEDQLGTFMSSMLPGMLAHLAGGETTITNNFTFANQISAKGSNEDINTFYRRQLRTAEDEFVSTIREATG